MDPVSSRRFDPDSEIFHSNLSFIVDGNECTTDVGHQASVQINFNTSLLMDRISNLPDIYAGYQLSWKKNPILNFISDQIPDIWSNIRPVKKNPKKKSMYTRYSVGY